MNKIVCIHQGYELYGSDRTFISCVEFIRDLHPRANIIVILPSDGDLSLFFREAGYDVVIRDLWVIRKSYGPFGLLLRSVRFPSFVASALRIISSADLVYINTGVVLDFIFAARWFSRRVVVHVHEIPSSKVLWVFRCFVNWSKARVIFNSNSTRKAFHLAARVKNIVVHNGVNVSEAASGVERDSSQPLKVLMIGRINAWKGQDLLVEAIALLPDALRGMISVRVVGDVFEGAPFRDRLLSQIRAAGVEGAFSLSGFQENPAPEYDWSDLVVVPSREPEPFGLVAIEAMAHSRPVVAAGHGGLVEIVLDGVTGRQFKPNDASDLALKLEWAIQSRAALTSMGEAGRERYLTKFTLDAFKKNFQKALTD